MSENYIEFIPENPRFVPSADSQEAAAEFLRSIAPHADRIEQVTDDAVMFRDAAANFESVACPSCRAELDMATWQDLMDADWNSGFELAAYTLACCSATTDLNSLLYSMPQGFSRFSLRVWNPNIDEISNDARRQLEGRLGCPIRVIYARL